MLPTQISERRIKSLFTGISKISILEDQLACLKERKSIKNYEKRVSLLFYTSDLVLELLLE